MNNTLTHEEILKFIENQPIRISVFGEFSSGKTTFINGLIGEAILSVAVDPTTAVPTYIRFAKEFNILVHLNNDNKLFLFEDEPPFWTRFVGRQSVLNTLKKQEKEIRTFLKEWTKEGERANEVKNIIIELPLPWLKNNLELVDTPGTNAGIDTHQHHTEQVSEDTDIAIFLMDARQGGGKKTEFNFMNKVHKAVSKSFVVINKLDLLDDDDDEREDILNFITDEAIPKHWQGVIQPQVFGISSLVRLDKQLAKNEPELIEEFKRLISVIENIAISERGKILLNRLGNPEKTLFGQAVKFESEQRFDKAHKIYFDLFDILQTAELDTLPAQRGIDRCEDILNGQVSELDEINKDIMEISLLENHSPDEALKRLKINQKRLDEINAPDKDINDSIIRLKKRIQIRDKARKDISACKQKALNSEKQEDYISSVEYIKQFHNFIDKAELLKDELQQLVDYEKKMAKKRDIDAQNKWTELQKQVNTYFKKYEYNAATKLIVNIKNTLPICRKITCKKAKS